MDRHWFPAILLGFSVALALVFTLVLSPQGRELLERTPDVRELMTPEQVVDQVTYTAAITSLLETYTVESVAEDTYNALVAVRVPADMLTLHYELVIAFGKLVQGNQSEGLARLAALKAQYSWLPL